MITTMNQKSNRFEPNNQGYKWSAPLKNKDKLHQECSPLFNGFDLKTEGTDNKFVKKHWIEAMSGETEIVAKNNAGNVDIISISGLTENTAYNLTTKFKVIA